MNKSTRCLTILLIVLSSPITTSQVGIGTVNPASGSIFDIESTDKGILIPRIALTGTNDITTIIPAATKGLLVFNTATVASGTTSVFEGFYYWNDTAWVPLSVNNPDWKLTGNDDVVNGINFLGTTDASNLNFITNNIERFRIPGSANQVQAMSEGTNTAPFYSWASDTDVGMWRPGTDQLALSAGGAEFIRLREEATNELVFNEGGLIVNTRIESQNDINMLFIDGSTNRIGVKTNAPQATLHLAGNNNSIRVDELNAANNINNIGTEPAPVYVNSTGELSLQSPLIMSKMPINTTTFINAGGVTISSLSGGFVTTNLETTTITLTQESLVYFSYQFSVNVAREAGGAIYDGAPRLYRAWVEVNTNIEIAYSAGTYTNAGGGTILTGWWYLDGEGYIKLPAGVHNIRLRASGYGGDHDYRITFGSAGKNLFQAVIHK